MQRKMADTGSLRKDPGTAVKGFEVSTEDNRHSFNGVLDKAAKPGRKRNVSFRNMNKGADIWFEVTRTSPEVAHPSHARFGSVSP